jgi:hypothetical protein
MKKGTSMERSLLVDLKEDITFSTSTIHKTRISITVHKGVYWESDSFILKDHCLIEKKDLNHIIRIKDITLEEQKESHKLSFTLKDHKKNTKAHIFASTFLPPNPCVPFLTLKSKVSTAALIETFPLSKPQNMYISNKKAEHGVQICVREEVPQQIYGQLP